MIHEFALEPELVASWHDRARYRFFGRKFGVGTARIVSRFPTHQWQKRVLAAFERTFEGTAADKEQAARRIEILVTSLTERSAYREGNLKPADAWLPQAVAEHTRRPFHAIVVLGRGQEQCPDLLVADEIDEDHAAWSPPRPLVPRTPADFAAALAPLVRCAREIRLVDPHFDASKERFRKPLRAILEQAANRRGPGETPVVEIHTCVTGRESATKDSTQERDRDDERSCAERLLRSCRKEIPALLPKGFSVSLMFWAEQTNGKDFHDRFVLTEVGGVTIGHGLDAHTSGAADDVITILSLEQYPSIAARFHANARVYDRVLPPERIPSPQRPRPAGR